MLDNKCFYALVGLRLCTSIRGSWGLSPCYIPCRSVWSEAFICICSCRPSVTTTACESRPVKECQQLKGMVVFVRSFRYNQKLNIALLIFLTTPTISVLSLVPHITQMPPHFTVFYSSDYFYWQVFYYKPGVKPQEPVGNMSAPLSNWLGRTG